MKKKILAIGICVIILASVLSSGCLDSIKKELEIGHKVGGPSSEKSIFPIDLNNVITLATIDTFFNLNESQRDFLQKNGFVGIINYGGYKNFAEAYTTLKGSYIPIFITTDSILHTYHIFFDDLLKSIEEDYLIGLSENMTLAMLEKSWEQFNNTEGAMKEAAEKNIAYFSIALKLIQPNATIPDFVLDVVEQELALIANHSGFAQSSIFKYDEDYSQYKPRGHYTRSERLKRYFKEMMWYGRMMFRVKSDRATIQAILIADGMRNANHNGLASTYWDVIYEVTAYFVGPSDDLTYNEYQSAIDEIYGTLSSNYNELTDTEKLNEFKDKIKTLRPPMICSSWVWDYQNVTEETQGLRFMGQRFIPDSYMFQELVYNKIGKYYGKGDPFTLVITDFGPIRGFPRGLDIFAVLGSQKALEILENESDTEYKNYYEQLNKLEEEFSNLSEDNWTQNMYWGWLYSLDPLNQNFSGIEEVPIFMESEAWQYEKLNTALSSWAELRHDTILYAKQSYTVNITGILPQPVFDEKGYVEPVPEFYERLIDLTNNTIKGLSALSVLSSASERNLNNFKSLLINLRDIANKELNNSELSEEEYKLIREIGEKIDWLTTNIDEKGKETQMIADVHTDPNSGQCLEEGVGYIDFVVVVVKLENGTLASMAGPIFSYYEFKQPMSNRLTDEQWKKLLEDGSEPDQQGWVGLFAP